MSELVERAARAGYEKFNEGLIGSLEPTWDNCEQSFKERMMDAQSAAIEAMREPTGAMVSACGSIEIERPGNDETNSTYELWSNEIIAVWQAMIDEALK